ncbi:radical SAM protein [Myxococcota bacterium]|nr:radical SAM protein [Myxococcota bacterium]MBU1535200.1 radical SAM protein [Myxococcota bacterium]
MWDRPLEYAVIEITNRCNLRCAFCASNSGQARPESFSLEEWKEVLVQLAELGGREITLIGGEIFLFPQWEEVARTVVELGMELVIITNGLLVNDDIYERMTAIPVATFGVSLDGPNKDVYKKCRGVDGFDRALALLKRLVADGYPQVNAVTTFTNANFFAFDEFGPLLENTGITWQIQIANAVSQRFEPELAFSTAQYALATEKISTLLLERNETLYLAPMDDFGYFPFDGALQNYHRHWEGCQGGLSVVGIRSNGDLLPCLSMGDPFIVGNLREISLEQAWHSSEVFSLFRNKEKNLTGECALCPKALDCRAGCSAMAFTSTGSVHDNRYCMRRISVDRALLAMDGLNPLGL